MEDQLYEVYIRNQDGDARDCDIRDGIKEFLNADNGYRISFNIEGVVITLRRGSVSDELRYLDSMLPQESLDCAVTIRGM
jgi:hypothetical protein